VHCALNNRTKVKASASGSTYQQCQLLPTSVLRQYGFKTNMHNTLHVIPVYPSSTCRHKSNTFASFLVKQSTQTSSTSSHTCTGILTPQRRPLGSHPEATASGSGLDPSFPLSLPPSYPFSPAFPPPPVLSLPPFPPFSSPSPPPLFPHLTSWCIDIGTLTLRAGNIRSRYEAAASDSGLQTTQDSLQHKSRLAGLLGHHIHLPPPLSLPLCLSLPQCVSPPFPLRFLACEYWYPDTAAKNTRKPTRSYSITPRLAYTPLISWHTSYAEPSALLSLLGVRILVP
jgi:hypothetical protein